MLAFGLGLVLGLLIGIIVPAEYRLWRETRSERDQRITERIYQPLYDELAGAAEANLPRDGPELRSHWDTLESHQQLQVRESLRTDLNDYSQKLKRVNLLESELSDVQDIRQSLPYGMLETRVTENGSKTRVTTPARASEEINLPIEEFLIEYGSVIETSMSAEEMHRRLAGTALQPFVAAWDEEYPGWEDAFWNAFQANGGYLVERAEERQQLIESDIPEHAARIRQTIGQRLQ